MASALRSSATEGAGHVVGEPVIVGQAAALADLTDEEVLRRKHIGDDIPAAVLTDPSTDDRDQVPVLADDGVCYPGPVDRERVALVEVLHHFRHALVGDNLGGSGHRPRRGDEQARYRRDGGHKSCGAAAGVSERAPFSRRTGEHPARVWAVPPIAWLIPWSSPPASGVRPPATARSRQLRRSTSLVRRNLRGLLDERAGA